MANNTLIQVFTAIADEIRVKKGTIEKLVADNFPEEIANLKTGFYYDNTIVKDIPDYSFYGCEDLRSVNCYNLESIGESAFENCANLESVILYEGVTSVGENAFKGCTTKIHCMFDSKPEAWSDNWNPSNCEVEWLGGAVGTWDISATEEDNVIAQLYIDVRNAGMYTLFISGDGNMDEYGMGMSPWYKSYGQNISSVNILSNVINIGGNAFCECSNISVVTLSKSMTNIGGAAFCECTKLTSINIPNGIQSIDKSAFRSCTSLTSVTIPDSVISIGGYAFNRCSSLTSVNIQHGITSISEATFHGCTSLISITIPDSVTTIAEYAFSNCTSLTSITIPDSVTSIADYAFNRCTSLTSIIYTGTTSQWNSIAFGSVWDNGIVEYTIHCTDGDITKDGTITYK